MISTSIALALAVEIFWDGTYSLWTCTAGTAGCEANLLSKDIAMSFSLYDRFLHPREMRILVKARWWNMLSILKRIVKRARHHNMAFVQSINQCLTKWTIIILSTGYLRCQSSLIGGGRHNKQRIFLFLSFFASSLFAALDETVALAQTPWGKRQARASWCFEALEQSQCLVSRRNQDDCLPNQGLSDRDDSSRCDGRHNRNNQVMVTDSAFFPWRARSPLPMPPRQSIQKVNDCVKNSWGDCNSSLVVRTRTVWRLARQHQSYKLLLEHGNDDNVTTRYRRC
jgi:hypothetical protein